MTYKTVTPTGIPRANSFMTPDKTWVKRIEKGIDIIFTELDKLENSDIDHVDEQLIDEMRSNIHDFVINLNVLEEGISS